MGTDGAGGMVRSVASAVRQALFGKTFVFGIVGVMAVLSLASVRQIVDAFRQVADAAGSSGLLAGGFHHHLMMEALSSEAMTMALPILAALPFTSAVVDDIKSGFVKEYLPRTTLTGYWVGRAVACVLSGGLTLVLGMLAAYIAAALLFTPMEAAPQTAFPDGAELAVYMAQLGEKGLLLFCSGGLWAMVGMLFAALTESRYMAYASPFVFYYVLIILYERYFDKLFILYPKEWVAPSGQWEFGSIGAALFVAELTAIAALCFGKVVQKRLVQI